MTIVSSNRKLARVAGLLYLGVVITGLFSLMYVPSQLMVSENASLTYNNIVASQPIFRLGIVTGLLCYTFFLFLAIALYKLLKPVHEHSAKLLLLFVSLSIPTYFLNAQNQFTVLSLINNAGNLGLSPNEIQAQVTMHLLQYKNGMRIVHLFSGLWLFPFGYLVFKSGFLPKFLGILLMLGGLGYLINFAGYTLIHDYAKTGLSSYISLPASIGEIGTCLWLLIVGAKEKKLPL